MKRPVRILSCKAGLSARCFRTTERTKTLMRVIMKQTCASCIRVTKVGLGKTVYGATLTGQGA